MFLVFLSLFPLFKFGVSDISGCTSALVSANSSFDLTWKWNQTLIFSTDHSFLSVIVLLHAKHTFSQNISSDCGSGRDGGGGGGGRGGGGAGGLKFSSNVVLEHISELSKYVITEKSEPSYEKLNTWVWWVHLNIVHFNWFKINILLGWNLF